MNEFYVNKNKSAVDLLGRSEYKAMSYGGYRTLSRVDQPSLSQIKEDLKILSAIGVKIIRTYNLQLDQAPNILKAIKTLKKEDDNFEMYVMLGLWIECENARLSPWGGAGLRLPRAFARRNAANSAAHQPLARCRSTRGPRRAESQRQRQFDCGLCKDCRH